MNRTNNPHKVGSPEWIALEKELIRDYTHNSKNLIPEYDRADKAIAEVKSYFKSLPKPKYDVDALMKEVEEATAKPNPMTQPVNSGTSKPLTLSDVTKFAQAQFYGTQLSRKSAVSSILDKEIDKIKQSMLDDMNKTLWGTRRPALNRIVIANDDVGKLTAAQIDGIMDKYAYTKLDPTKNELQIAIPNRHFLQDAREPISHLDSFITVRLYYQVL